MTTMKYHLLSTEKSLKFSPLNMEGFEFDLTSVVNTLESTGDPGKLFHNCPGANAQLLNHLIENINNIALWVNSTVYPSISLMRHADIRRALGSLQALSACILEVIKKGKLINHSSKNKLRTYECQCKCNEVLVLPNNGCAWQVLQDHEHIEKALCSTEQPATSDSEISSIVSDLASVSGDDDEEGSSEDNNVSASDLSLNSVDSIQFGMDSLSVLKVFYPPPLVRKVRNLENNGVLYTIQKVTSRDFRCLLCNVELNSENNIGQHVVGTGHTNALANLFFVARLQNYHQVFSEQLPSKLLVNMSFFVPNEHRNTVTCKLCSEAVTSANLQCHIATPKHVGRLSQKKHSRNYFYELIMMLVERMQQADVNGATEASSAAAASYIASKLVYNSNYKSGGSNEARGSKPELDAAKEMARMHNVRPALPEAPQTQLDMLEHRFQLHKVFIKYFEKRPVCVPCATPLADNKNALKTHFMSKEHTTKAQTPQPLYRYVCDVCPQPVNNEFNWSKHLRSLAHKQRVPKSAKATFSEYECTTCEYVIFGNEDSVNKHKAKQPIPPRKPRTPKEVKLPARMKLLLQNEHRLTDEVKRLVNESQAVLSKLPLSWKCCVAIQNALQLEFGLCRAYPFGSRISGLGSGMSDLDVFVDTGMMYEGLTGQDPESQAKLVKRTAKVLKKHPDFADITAIPSARTPIVQVYHKVTGLDCDLSFRHALSVENTEFLKLCIEVQPVLKMLILTLKNWSGSCRLNSKISTYAVAMLSIFFMQASGYLLSVKALRDIDPTEPKTIGGWKSFCFTKPVHELKSRVIKCNLPIRELIHDFFMFYISYEFDTMVVCPLLGKSVLKSDFLEDKANRLPPEMSTYVDRINTDKEFEVFRSNVPMCIQDPFDLSHNLTKACTNEFVKKFITLCRLSLDAMS